MTSLYNKLGIALLFLASKVTDSVENGSAPVLFKSDNPNRHLRGVTEPDASGFDLISQQQKLINDALAKIDASKTDGINPKQISEEDLVQAFKLSGMEFTENEIHELMQSVKNLEEGDSVTAKDLVGKVINVTSPTGSPTVALTFTPTAAPISTPTVAPTSTPTVAPTSTPTGETLRDDSVVLHGLGYTYLAAISAFALLAGAYLAARVKSTSSQNPSTAEQANPGVGTNVGDEADVQSSSPKGRGISPT